MSVDAPLTVTLTSRLPTAGAGGIEAVVAALQPRLQGLEPAWRVRAVHAFDRHGFWSRLPFIGDVVAAVSLAVRTRRDDVVVVNGGEYAWPRMLTSAMRRRTIVVWHGTRAYEVRALRAQASFALRLYAAAQQLLCVRAVAAGAQISVSPKVALEVREAYRLRGKIRVIVNGAPARARISSVARATEGPRVLWVGTTSYKKGLDIAVDAVEILRQTHPSAELHIAGMSPEQTHLPPWAVVHGRLPHDRMSALYLHSDAVCCSTRYEGCSVAVLEAMAFGVPVVGSSSIAWMLGESTGADDAASCARHLARIIGDSAVRAALLARQDAALNNFDWRAAAVAYAEIIRERMALCR